MPTLAPAPNAHINEYPPERNFVRPAIAVSFGCHLGFLLLIGLIALIFHVKSLRQLMLEGGTVQQDGPAPEQKMEVFLQPEDPPPPPVGNPEFIREIIKPKVEQPPAPKPVPPKPQPPVMKPKYTAQGATGSGESQAVSKLVVGSSGLPHPTYPTQAKLMHMSGTVVVTVQFDSSGGVSDAEVETSSGSGILDNYTRTFIRENWHNGFFAGKRETVPVNYTLEQ